MGREEWGGRSGEGGENDYLNLRDSVGCKSYNCKVSFANDLAQLIHADAHGNSIFCSRHDKLCVLCMDETLVRMKH